MAVKKNFLRVCAIAAILASWPVYSQKPAVRFEPCEILSAVASSEKAGRAARGAVDGRSDTWWSPSRVRGAWILVDFSSAQKAAAVEFVNGAGGRDASGRPHFGRMGRIAKGEAELSNGARVSFELSDSPAPQRVVLPSADIRWVKIHILSFRSGKASKDVCLSEISVLKAVPIYSL